MRTKPGAARAIVMSAPLRVLLFGALLGSAASCGDSDDPSSDAGSEVLDDASDTTADLGDSDPGDTAPDGTDTDGPDTADPDTADVTDGGTDTTPDAVSDTGDATDADAGSDTSLPDEPTEALISAETGGRIEHAGAQLLVPGGALAEDITLSVDARFGTIEDAEVSGAIYTFGPAGTTFSKPVRIALPTAGRTTGITIWWTDAEGTFEPIGTTVEDGFAVGFVTHFSQGAVVVCGSSTCAAPTATCTAGVVESTQSTCSSAGTCIDVTDTFDCGSGLPNAVGTCAGPACGIASCNTGFSDCDRRASNGCETVGGCGPGVCGDGVIDAGEACDDGNTSDGDGCSSTCTIERVPACGDGIIDAAEACDDGNTADGDGCSATCTIANGWACIGVPSTCATLCGDGVVAGAEACDDANTSPGDGCDATCGIEAGWACIGVPSVCTTTCGDGVMAGAEECDDGNANNGDGCSATCTVERIPLCGDGILDPTFGEQCDDGGESASCDVDCTFAACGDNTLNVTSGEQCDDGNLMNGDGCSSTCQTEPP